MRKCDSVSPDVHGNVIWKPPREAYFEKPEAWFQ